MTIFPAEFTLAISKCVRLLTFSKLKKSFSFNLENEIDFKISPSSKSYFL